MTTMMMIMTMRIKRKRTMMMKSEWKKTLTRIKLLYVHRVIWLE